MKKSYRYAVTFFALFSVLLLASGTWLFALKIGFSPQEVTAYYLGDAASYTQPKSLYGLLEVALPHLGSMGLFIMVTGHFLIFTPVKQRRLAVMLITGLFLAALANILSPFGIIAGLTQLVWLKLFAFALLQILGLLLLWLVFNATVTGILSERKKPSGALRMQSNTTKGIQ